ncbi:META and DUF4377 domain-containing protein [Lysobacter sp. GX 14042]|uniref:META and DUF4377 domain-containing protein n=1 Tax=Lysobacter sp. GX 14042 TaxID=2907155 RepID=UPI001F18B467|nr:META and DUF4377 domain-containing protein [Lysobacter sp. GX 14042]MCE7032280.1 META and DUF4377 domain-containing protein [Lysobacter sp. GX 14042]
MSRKLPLALPALLAAAVAGCTATGGAALGGEPVTDAPDAVLTGHSWVLEEATGADGARLAALFPDDDHRLRMVLDEDRIGVSGACNRASAGYRLQPGGTLEVGEMASTLMGCPEPLMRADRAIHDLLAAGPLQLRIEATAPPRLVLESADGTRSLWTGEPTAETRYGGPGELMFLEVAPAKVACNHPLIAGHQCLQVRELHYDASGIRQSPPGGWQPLYAQIEGFEFVEGERKVLRVKRFTPERVPADAPAVAYVLDMVVEAERMAPAP